MFLALTVLLLAVPALRVEGHARFLEPPSRASAWRVGFSTPPDYSDNQLFCGGKPRQWDRNGGKCGICGDPFDAARPHEAGGRFATGQILRTYTQGQVIDARVDITANHLGYFEFRICPHNDVTTPAKQECFDRNLLQLADGSGTRYMITANMKDVRLKLKLPEDMTCTQCIIQWHYNTGNNWGVDFETGVGCSGCGPQEQYYGCADVAITAASGGGAAPGTLRPPAGASPASTRAPAGGPGPDCPQTPELDGLCQLCKSVKTNCGLD